MSLPSWGDEPWVAECKLKGVALTCLPSVGDESEGYPTD